MGFFLVESSRVQVCQIKSGEDIVSHSILVLLTKKVLV